MMMLVAIVAVIIAAERGRRNWADCQDKAKHWTAAGRVLLAGAEELDLQAERYSALASQGAPPRGSTASWAERADEARRAAEARRWLAGWDNRRAQHYRRAALRPWEAVGPEPSPTP